MNEGLVYLCCDDRRRAELRRPEVALNGIDYLEVVDTGAPPADRQRVLRVHFVKPPGALSSLGPADMRIEGGVRIRDVRVEQTSFDGDVLVVRVSQPGDFSTYTLRLLEGVGTLLDPLLSAVDFSFKVECESDFDCRQDCDCPPDVLDEPEIDYLAKDFTSFRQLLLDRMALVAPGWTERNPADVGVALVELLAYVGDHLSYEQDALATEAYLGTARRRASVRRHANLVDYRMHDGCNARTWVHVEVRALSASDATDGILLPRGTQLLTQVPDTLPALVAGTEAHLAALVAGPEVFETMADARLFPEHRELPFYLWGQQDCCLPAGATRATVAGHFPHLREGDVVVLEEVLGPHTGEPEDADRTHRHPVRLTAEPELVFDELFPDPDDPTKPMPITELEWGAQDALPFALCLSGTTDADHGARPIDGISVARGNVVLADHGLTIADESLGAPEPAPDVLAPAASSCDRCEPREAVVQPRRFEPLLREAPLTQTAHTAQTVVVEGRRQRLAFDPRGPATSALEVELDQVLPAIRLRDASGKVWLPQRDLLGSDAFAPEFVAEVDDQGGASLRFGDGLYGERPTVGVELTATYRVGNGARGNVGADALRHLVAGDSDLADHVVAVRNAVPARGGTDAERLEHVRQSAPAAFRTLERAVTPEDYTTLAGRHREVQRAQATIRWTGSWRTVFLTVDRVGGLPVDADFEDSLRAHLERFRMAGHDLEIDGPRFVALEVELTVCVRPEYFRSDVELALREMLGSGAKADGRRGAFHPDNFTFGQPVFLSPLLAAAQSVTGVAWAEFTAFQRLGLPSRAALDAGSLSIGRLEIARLDNDPSFPERGVLRLLLKGGR
jgi:hypothetical protein